MSAIKKQFCLILVLNVLVINHVVAMDDSSSNSSSFRPGHHRAHSTGSSFPKSPTRNVTITNIDSPKKGESSAGNLNDIDGEIPCSPKRRPQSPPIIITPNRAPQDVPAEAFLNRENHFDNTKLNINIVPTVSLGGKNHNSTWSESISSPVYWMPVITGAATAITTVTLKGIIEWVTTDREISAIEKRLILSKYANAEIETENESKSLENKRNAITHQEKVLKEAQTIVDRLLSKQDNGEELSNHEHKILQTKLSLIQAIANS